MIRLAIFDCDGTLVDSHATICIAVEEAFAIARLVPPTRAAIRRIVGLNLFEAMRALLPEEADDATVIAMAQDYRTAFFRVRASSAGESEPLFDGMIEALDRLAAAGWHCGIATGKSDRGLAQVLAQHGIADRFITLQTADRHPSKPDPSMIRLAMAEAGATPETTVMIGDTSFDMAMARFAGATAIGVAWGYHPADELFAAGARAVAETAADLPRHLDIA